MKEMNEKEIRESFIVASTIATVKFGKVSLDSKIESFRLTVLILEASLNFKKEIQKKLLLFLETVKQKGPVGGTNMILEEIKDDKYWREIFSYFLPNGPLNEKIIKIFLSANKEAMDAGTVFLEEAKSELKQLEELNKECKN